MDTTQSFDTSFLDNPRPVIKCNTHKCNVCTMPSCNGKWMGTCQHACVFVRYKKDGSNAILGMYGSEFDAILFVYSGDKYIKGGELCDWCVARMYLDGELRVVDCDAMCHRLPGLID